MTEITIPLKLEELLQADSGFQVISEWNPCDLVDEEIQGHIEDLVSLTQSEGGLDQLNQETIDALYSLVTNFTALSDENKELFVEALTELTTAAVATIVDNLSPAARNARKQLVFFLVSFMQANEQMERDESSDNSDKPKATKTKGKKSTSKDSSSSFSWVEWRHACMKIVYDALCSEPSHLWSMGLVGENYLFGMWSYHPKSPLFLLSLPPVFPLFTHLRLSLLNHITTLGMWSFALALLDEKPVGVAGIGHVESNVRGLCVAIITRCASLFGGGSTGVLAVQRTYLTPSITHTFPHIIYPQIKHDLPTLQIS